MLESFLTIKTYLECQKFLQKGIAEVITLLFKNMPNQPYVGGLRFHDLITNVKNFFNNSFKVV